MRRVEIAGSYYELGLEYGRILSENKLDWWWTQPTEAKLALVKCNWPQKLDHVLRWEN